MEKIKNNFHYSIDSKLVYEPVRPGHEKVSGAHHPTINSGKIRLAQSVFPKANKGNSRADKEGIGREQVNRHYFEHTLADAVSHVHTNMYFLYIGTDQRLFEHFVENFEMCFEAVNLSDASEFLQQLYLQNKRLPDVIFIDLALNEHAVRKFCVGLSSNLILNNLPIVYNEKRLSDNETSSLHQLQLIDDIITIDFNQTNYYSKIMFLKQSKLHNQLLTGKTYSSKSFLPAQKNSITNLPLFLKRLTDIIVSMAGLIFLSPFLILIAAIIKIESKGPVFYTALRAGKGFKVFNFYKFRSMVANADKEVDNLSHQNQYNDANGPKFFKINNDPRVTKVGKFLRNTSIDEIPQLLNVLKGDMSLVGNRPLPIYEAVTLTTDEFVERFSAPAGITGLWQVKKRGKADMSTEERIQLDICYSRNYNFVSDLKIIVRTPLALFQKTDV